MKLRKRSDIHLIEAYFEQYYEMLCKVAFQYVKDHQEAEDIVQDFFYLLWQKNRAEKIEGQFEHYAVRSIRNNCLNVLKKKQLPIQDISSDFHHLGEDHDDMEIRIAYEQRLEDVAASIQLLPDRQREAIDMNIWGDLKYQEISDRLQVSINTVKTHIKLAYKNLRRLNS